MIRPLDKSIFLSTTVQQANPAAGANFTWTVPSGVRVLPVSVVFQITTDANAANRTVNLDYNNGVVVFAVATTQVNITAGLTRQMRFSVGLGNCFQESASGNLHGPLNPQLFLYPTQTLSSNVRSIQAGDQLSSIYITYLYWPYGA